MPTSFQVKGGNRHAPFTLKIHRGEGMVLMAMNWRRGRPPDDFVGFGIQYVPPGRRRPLNVMNRLTFEGDPRFGERQPSILAPIQKFRWVHFPHEADRPGAFRYIVTPIFMDADDRLRRGEAQEASIELSSQTHPDRLNLGFTRGFIASQAFVDRFEKDGEVNTLLPAEADQGLAFVPTHPKAPEALAWMGFEARRAILEVLDRAIADPSASVRIVAFDLSEPGIVSRMERLGPRLRVIIDDSGQHGTDASAESEAARRLRASAGERNVARQHSGKLQHNKTIVVTGPNRQTVVCGSTNFSWRGLFVQNNNMLVLTGEAAVAPFAAAFEQYFSGGTAAFKKSPAVTWTELGLRGIKAWVTFSPHGRDTAVLTTLADDVRTARSSLLYSLAFLAQTGGAFSEAVRTATADPDVFVVGISDKAQGGVAVQTPEGKLAAVHAAALSGVVPAPFSKEPAGGGGIRMHHKFVVIDFDKPTARVYAGSYNFSPAADVSNGENLLLIRDRRVATAFAVEAVRLFDHYQFRVKQGNASRALTRLSLRKPPRRPGEVPWFDGAYTVPSKILDRRLFA